MARGTSLLLLRHKFRAEARHSTQLSVGTDSQPHVDQLLRRTQEMLYADPANDWAFLRMYPIKPIVAGSIYYDPPADLNIDRIEDVRVIVDTQPRELTRGIGFEEYAQYDRDDTDVRASPVQRWDLRWTGSSTQIEVWPRPAENSTLIFKCLRPLRDLTDDADVADLDDILITLFAAAEELAAEKSKDAEIKLTLAQRHLAALKANAQSGAPMVQMGLSNYGVRPGRARVEVS